MARADFSDIPRRRRRSTTAANLPPEPNGAFGSGFAILDLTRPLFLPDLIKAVTESSVVEVRGDEKLQAEHALLLGRLSYVADSNGVRMIGLSPSVIYSEAFNLGWEYERCYGLLTSIEFKREKEPEAAAEEIVAKARKRLSLASSIADEVSDQLC